MNQQKTIALIKRYYDSFNQQNLAEFFSLLADNVQHDINQGGCESGKTAFMDFMQRMNRCYQETIVDLAIMANPEGTRAAAEFMVQGCYIATDHGLPEAKKQNYNLPGGAFFDIREDKIIRVTNYYNLQTWLYQISL